MTSSDLISRHLSLHIHNLLFFDIVAFDAILFLIMESSAHELPTLATVFSLSLSASFRSKMKRGLANGFSICLNTADLLKAQDQNTD